MPRPYELAADRRQRKLHLRLGEQRLCRPAKFPAAPVRGSDKGELSEEAGKGIGVAASRSALITTTKSVVPSASKAALASGLSVSASSSSGREPEPARTQRC